jgi:ubiquinone/menaquinone biosynthesis C-methylase UbiE
MFGERFIGRQLGHPSGITSGLVAIFMNRTHAYMNKATVQLLGINSTDRVLDIGFGGGSAMVEMTKLAHGGLVAGIEVSDAMLKRGRKKFSKLISQGQVELKEGSASQIPYPPGFFNKVSTVNCIYFWPDAVAGLKEVHRVLKNGGVFVISVFSKDQLEKFPPARHGFAIYSDGQLQDFLNTAGFVNIRTEHIKHRPMSATLIIGSKA